MLDELVLTGFKRHSKRTKIPLAPITLLLGANSSGKSSVIQSLLAMRQSVDRGRLGFTSLETLGPLAPLGRFGNVQSGHDPKVKVGIELGWENRSCAFLYGDPDWERKGRLESNENELCGLLLDDGGGRSFCADPFSLRADRSVRAETSLSGGYTHGEVGPADVTVVWTEYGDGRRVEFNGAGAGEPGHPNEGVLHLVDNTLYPALDIFTRLRHVGPLRRPGQRTYEVNTWHGDDVGAAGEHLATVLVRGDRLATVNRLMKQVGVPYQLQLIKIQTLGNTFDIRLVDTRGGDSVVGVGDVGFGVSQILPILANWALQLEAMGADQKPWNTLFEELGSSSSVSSGGLLMVEQPELHLHPAWQVELLRLIAQPVAFWRGLGADGRLRRCLPQVILETHGVVVVRAVQQLVRLGRISPEDVSIVSFSTDPLSGEPDVRRIGMTEKGKFIGSWPDGFFPQEERLLYSDDLGSDWG